MTRAVGGPAVPARYRARLHRLHTARGIPLPTAYLIVQLELLGGEGHLDEDHLTASGGMTRAATSRGLVVRGAPRVLQLTDAGREFARAVLGDPSERSHPAQIPSSTGSMLEREAHDQALLATSTWLRSADARGRVRRFGFSDNRVRVLLDLLATAISEAACSA